MREDAVGVGQAPAVMDRIWAVNKRILLEVERVQTRMEPQIDPLAELFEQGMDEFVNYQKERPEDYVTRAQKTKAKLEKLARDMNDPVLRRIRNKERRKAQQTKISNYLDTLDKEGVRKFLDQRKQKKKALKEKVKLAAKHGQSVFIDLVYEKMMNPKENKSLAKQIELITIAIKYLDHPPAVHLCSLGGVVEAQLQRMSYLNLQLCPHTENVLQVGKALGKKLIYLSPDAELPLEGVEDDTAYIIGGLVDRSIIKHASQMRARDLCVEARHLPIRDFMKSRTCLNLDHVVMMICKFKDCGDWKTAFEYAAPKRWKKDSKIEGKASQGSECSEDSCEEEFNDKIK